MKQGNLRKRIIVMLVAVVVLMLCLPATGRPVQAASWKKSGSTWYCYDAGKKVTNKWMKKNGKWAFLKKNGKMAVSSFITWKGQKYYVNKDGFRQSGWKTIKGEDYFFDSYGVLDADAIRTEKGKTTLKNFLRIAMKPVGNTMYIWGGGWNKADTAAGEDAKSMGVSPKWKIYADQQTSAYDFNQTRYKLGYGLDCSGYVGWVVYNNLNTKSGNAGYVMKARLMASNFASRGWGSYRTRYQIQDYKPGDVMSSSCTCCGHVWIVIGQCTDGSVVLVHSSPSGVQISGTVTPSGGTNSKAAALAARYMKSCFPSWYNRYGAPVKNLSYLGHYGQMRWSLDGSSVMTDPDGFAKKSPSAILKALLS